MRNQFFKLGFTTMALCVSQISIAEDLYTIYPIPQQQVAQKGTARLTSEINVVIENGIDEATKNRLIDVLTQQQLKAVFSTSASTTNSNLFIGINGSKGVADLLATSENLNRDVFQKKNKFDRHCVVLSEKNGLAQILILGENTDAAFYGLASLEQMLEKDLEALPCVQIYDYADQKSRGIVEGYYGYPYSVDVKKDLMRYMMRFKMNTYLYGAKSDPYHSGYWKNPYPTQLTEAQIKNGWLSQDMVKDLASVSHQTKVNFIWAIHPGNAIMNSNSVVKDVMSKFNMMYQLGVRQFAVFVDDVGVPNADAEMNRSATNVANIQKELVKKYNVNYTAATDTVRPLHFVPQVYCSSWVGEDQRKRFFKSLQILPKQVTVYTTGWGVWSVPNQGDFNLTARELGRPAAWWWNYPCNDNADAQVFPMDMYSNFYDMPAVNDNARMAKELTNGEGIVCNPMQQGEISKIPVFSAADYAWNTSGFNNIKSWNASFATIVGKEKAEALQTVAKYIRWNDPEELNGLINQYKNSLKKGTPQIDKLKKTLDDVQAACQVIEGLKDSETLSDRLLYKDLSPWLLKLSQMTKSASAMLVASASEDTNGEKWSHYVGEIVPVAGLDSAERYKVYSLEGMGENPAVGVRQSAAARRYLYPFTQFLKENALGQYFKPTEKELSLISNVKDLKGKVVLVNDSVGLDAQEFVLDEGQYVGFALPSPKILADVLVEESLLKRYKVLYSTNGKQWKTYTDKATFLNEYVKYLCIKNEQKETARLQLPLQSFSVVLGEPTRIEKIQLPTGPIWNEGGYLHDESLMCDGDYNTFTCLNQNQRNGDKYTLELNKVTPIHDVRVCMGTTNGDHMEAGVVEISMDGKSWKQIVVKGTSKFDFIINMPQAVQYSNNMKYCDFDGKGVEAKFVRFYVKSARTNKWLRFYEMEVNKQFENPVAKATIPTGGAIWQGHGPEYLYDGNYNTYLCQNRLQRTGDRYVLELKKPTKVYEVRVAVGTTNGDHMNSGMLQVSENGSKWTKLKVKGTNTENFTMDLPEVVKYSNEVNYCDFEHDGSEVKFVRFMVGSARTDKWLRMYEIQINPNDKSTLAACVDHNGNAIASLDDAVAYTGNGAVDQSLTYHFNSLNLIKSVVIYQDASASTSHPATIKVTSDGENWNDMGSLTQNKQVVDLSNQSDAIAMKLEWEGKHCPSIYEIVSNFDESKFAEVTKVEKVTTTGDEVDFTCNGKSITVASTQGIGTVEMFTLDGKAVMNYEAANSQKVQIPLWCQAKQTYVVRVTLSNGEKATYKVYCK